MLFFALNGSDRLGRQVARTGGFDIARHEEREFDGGEHKARPLVDVRGQDVLVLHSLNGDPKASANDKTLCLLFFLAACPEHGAARVTAIAPHLAYSRKGRQTKRYAPVTIRYVAQLFEATGVAMVVTFDVHNLAAFQNAFRGRTLQLSTDRLFATHIAARSSKQPPAIVSPDPGGVKRAQLVREALEAVTGGSLPIGFMEKRRSAGMVSGTHFAGDVKGCAVFILDDMICGGSTILRAVEVVCAHGAAEVHAIATHDLLTDAAVSAFSQTTLVDTLTVTDSVAALEATRDALGDRLRILTCAPLIADAIKRLHQPLDGGQ